MHESLVGTSNEEWTALDLDRRPGSPSRRKSKSKKDSLGCAYIFAFFIPILGLLMGLFMLPNEDTRGEAIGPIALSVVMMIVYGVIYALLEGSL